MTPGEGFQQTQHRDASLAEFGFCPLFTTLRKDVAVGSTFQQVTCLQWILCKCRKIGLL